MVAIWHSGPDQCQPTASSLVVWETRWIAARRLRVGQVMCLQVGRVTAHTGDHGAVWLFQDPEDRIPNNPGITVDFRAFGLATNALFKIQV